MRVRWRLVMVAGLAVALLTTGAVLIRPAVPPAGQARPGTSTVDDLSAAITAREARLARLPGDWLGWAELGMAYVQQARVTSDPSYYSRADAALARSLTVGPDANAPALAGLGAVAAARHEFATALRHGQAAAAADPYNAAAHGVVFDALVELGRYDEAETAVQSMIDLRPDTGSYARASYLFELRGRVSAAREAMQLALESASTPADTAFARVHLGQLAFDAGDLTTASSHVDEGLRVTAADPGLRLLRARVAAAAGDLPGAAIELRSVLSRLPLPDYAATLGDVLAAQGDAAGAATAYGLVAVQADLLAAAGVATNLELVGYAADRAVLDRTPLPAGTADKVVAAYRARPSVGSADTVAWVLHAAGRHREALSYADAALRLGTRSALVHFHRGVIRLATGDRAGARADLAEALRINPHFSVRYAPIARTTLGGVS